MSVHEQAAAAILSHIALAANRAVLRITLAYIAVRSILKFTAASSALCKIRDAPSLRVSDLRSVLSQSEGSDSSSNDSEGGKLVIICGVVEAKSVVDGNWKNLRSNVLVSHEFGEKGVILYRIQTCIYNEWRGFFGWISDLRSLFSRSWKEQESVSLRMVPFILHCFSCEREKVIFDVVLMMML
ncbi:E3 ubiquitin-protein ligase SPL2 [Camellia lanceoleosa]|uniref:E3 ubiquitin-protein ligase SPL2 n=1 Tax=Camellia lanceoleosa TaxID=1840588 RepID=A0ACC0I175_9ERIC|nr:E3 ubiquitin-protein ligase SPL2 [Camellia lanceoleosa]